ncbi:MAG: EAL domain-containing protein [Pseudomonadota bacterium]
MKLRTDCCGDVADQERGASTAPDAATDTDVLRDLTNGKRSDLPLYNTQKEGTDPSRPCQRSITKQVCLGVEALASSNREIELYASIIDQVSDRICMIGTDYRLRLTNKANLIHHDKPIEALIGHHISEIVGRQFFLTEGKARLDQCFAGETLRFQRESVLGGRILDIVMEPYREEDGTVAGAVVTHRDVTEAHRMSERLAYQASHDELTELLNRRTFEHHLHAVINETVSHGCLAAICFIDLDQFKVINDTAGHIVGDQLLHQVGRLLSSRVREHDILARLGGDEFGLILRECSLVCGKRFAEGLISALGDHRFSHEDRVFEIGASIGVAPISRQTQNLNDIMAQADLACYAAKESGRNRVCIYERGNEFLLRRQAEMTRLAKVRAALDNDEFVLYAQPIVALKASGTKRHRLEMLLRMKDDDGGLIMPSTFIPAAERYGLMPEVDCWVIKNTMKALADPRGAAGGLRVNINLSGVTLSDESSLDFVKQTLNAARMSLEHVCFEVTETSAIRNMAMAETFMTDVKQLGCSFALDDFGSGLSSLSYLERFPVDYIKVNGTLVSKLNDRRGRAVVKAIHQLAKSLDIWTVAEGVEDATTYKTLKRLDIDFVQGFVVGQPRPLDEAARSLS